MKQRLPQTYLIDMIRRKTALKRKVAVKKKTAAQISKERSMHHMYEKKALDADLICTGCGINHSLTHSHIISRGDKDFMDDPRNVTYHCSVIDGANGCSNLWEEVGVRSYLLDYKRNMEFIAEVRPKLFRAMIVKDYNFFEKYPDKICHCRFFDYICREFKTI